MKITVLGKTVRFRNNYLALITVFLTSFNARATIYYVSNTGSDLSNGTSTGTAWQTIAKVNASSFSPGDQILFKKGDSWNERLVPPSSGSAGNVITFGAYGTGVNPILTGFQTLTFVDQGSNIWMAIFANSVQYQNTVYINGAVRAKGRYPNVAFLGSSYGNAAKTQIKGSLTGLPNSTGGQIAMKTVNWGMETRQVTSQVGDTINFSPANYYATPSGVTYFIQNTPSVLDLPNEWCDTATVTTHKIYVYATSQPTGKASSLDTLIALNNVNYITINNIDLEGANIVGIGLNKSNNVTIDSYNISKSGYDGIRADSLVGHLTITNGTITDSWNDGIALNPTTAVDFSEHDDIIISGNTVTNSGMKFGMGKSTTYSYCGIATFGDRASIYNNTIIDCGYIAVGYQGDTCHIKYNYINGYCRLLHDGGAIYTFNSAGHVQKLGSEVIGNTVLNGTQDQSYTSNTSPQVVGIYCDGSNQLVSILIDSNTVGTVDYCGMLINNGRGVTIKHNRIWGFGFMGVYYFLSPSTNHTFVGNEIYSNLPIGYGGRYLAYPLDPTYTPTIDSNFYSRPNGESIVIRTAGGVNYDFTGWVAATGKDTHGGKTPTGITSAEPIYKYNYTASPTTQSLTGTYIDMRGVVFNNSITLQPHTSAILFKATQDIMVETFQTNRFNSKIRLKVRH